LICQHVISIIAIMYIDFTSKYCKYWTEDLQSTKNVWFANDLEAFWFSPP